METKDLLLVSAIIGTMFWYFNMRGDSKCIVYNQKCEGATCVKQQLK